MSIARVHARVDGEDGLELARSASTAEAMSGYCSLMASARPSCADGAMHLAEGGGRRRLRVEGGKARCPVGAKLGLHAALGEGRAHRRGGRLQLRQLAGVFGRQRLGDGGQQLRHLHQRALEAAERGCQIDGATRAVVLDAEQALAGDARRDGPDVGADLARSARRGQRSGSLRWP